MDTVTCPKTKEIVLTTERCLNCPNLFQVMRSRPESPGRVECEIEGRRHFTDIESIDWPV